jgi:hypothetical protein
VFKAQRVFNHCSHVVILDGTLGTPFKEPTMGGPIRMNGPYKNIIDAVKAGFSAVPDSDSQLVEFYFFVYLKSNHDRTFSYCFTDPQRAGPTEVEAQIEPPPGLIVRAFCHTHPHTDTSGQFGPDDKAHFLESRKKIPGIVWYLRNAKNEIRFAVDESQFPAGTPLN